MCWASGNSLWNTCWAHALRKGSNALKSFGKALGEKFGKAFQKPWEKASPIVLVAWWAGQQHAFGFLLHRFDFSWPVCLQSCQTEQVVWLLFERCANPCTVPGFAELWGEGVFILQGGFCFHRIIEWFPSALSKYLKVPISRATRVSWSNVFKEQKYF